MTGSLAHAPSAKELCLGIFAYLRHDDLSFLLGTSAAWRKEVSDGWADVAEAQFRGVQIWRQAPQQIAKDLHAQLQANTQRKLVGRCRWNSLRRHSSATWPLSISLESAGQHSVEFSVSCWNALNGCPCIGVIDADMAAAPGAMWRVDWSRAPHARQGFAMALEPFAGRLHAAFPSEEAEELAVLKENTTTCTSALNWRMMKNRCVIAGLRIEGGALTFFRRGPGGVESSSIVCTKLPPRLVPCVFMFDFVGAAEVWSLDVAHGNCSSCQHQEYEAPIEWEPWPLRDTTDTSEGEDDDTL